MTIEPAKWIADLCAALLRQGTDRDGNWGHPSTVGELDRIGGEADKVFREAARSAGGGVEKSIDDYCGPQHKREYLGTARTPRTPAPAATTAQTLDSSSNYKCAACGRHQLYTFDQGWICPECSGRYMGKFPRAPETPGPSQPVSEPRPLDAALASSLEGRARDAGIPWPKAAATKPESGRTGDDRATNPKTDDLLPVKSSASSPVHASDCAVHNMPAYPAGPCDCGAVPAPADASQGKGMDKHHGECATCGEEIGEDHVRNVNQHTGQEWHMSCPTPAAPPVQGEGLTEDEATRVLHQFRHAHAGSPAAPESGLREDQK